MHFTHFLNAFKLLQFWIRRIHRLVIGMISVIDLQYNPAMLQAITKRTQNIREIWAQWCQWVNLEKVS